MMHLGEKLWEEQHLPSLAMGREGGIGVAITTQTIVDTSGNTVRHKFKFGQQCTSLAKVQVLAVC